MQSREMIESQRRGASTRTMENVNTATVYYDSVSTEPGEMDISEAPHLAKPHPNAQLPGEGTKRVSRYDYPAVPGSWQSTGSVWPDHKITSTKPASVSVPSTENIVDGHSSNIVIFGETGVGKSSIINLITGKKWAHTSNDAVGCTFKHERYDIKLDGVACTLWDTTGLDEGSEGTVPADVAEMNLRALIGELARTGGIHLVIYCIRGNRLTKALKRNYDLFYVTVCRRKVPVALVVTGLEHQEGEMETWWHANEGRLQQSGMRFDAHACVTTLDAENQTIQDRRSESRSRLRKLVLEYAKLPPWRMKRSFLSWISSILRGALHKIFSTGRPGDIKTIRKVIICDVATNPQTLVQVSPGIAALCQRFGGLIGDKQYEFVRVDKRALETELQHEEGAGVLVFYTSALVGNEIPQEDIATLKTFYDTVGYTCPVIVILRGCDEETAHKLWGDVALYHSDIRAKLNFLPSTEDGQSNKLNEMIEMLCIEHVEVREPKAGKRHYMWFWRPESRMSPDPEANEVACLPYTGIRW